MDPYRGIQIGHNDTGYYFIWILSDGTVIDLGFYDSLDGGLMHIIEVDPMPEWTRQTVIEIREMARFCRWDFEDTVRLIAKTAEDLPVTEEIKVPPERKWRLLKPLPERLARVPRPGFVF